MLKQDAATRQKIIRKIVKKQAVSDQNQLVELLREEGIDANQAVVSRDLRKLGIVKKMVQGAFVYEAPELDVAAEILRLALVDIDYNESMIVIKTHPALADFVGDCIDQYSDLDIMGCLAGENTVFVAPKSIKTIRQTYEKLCERFNFKKKKDP